MNRGRSGSRRPNRGGGRFNKPGTANRVILSSSVKHDTEEVEELFEDDEEYAEEYDDFVAAVRDSTTEKANSKPVKTRVRSRNRALIQTLQMSADNQRMIKEVLQDLQVSREGHELKEIRYFDDRQMKRNEDYWRKVGERKLVVEGVVNFSEDCDSEAERKDQIYSSHAIKKLIQCGFERTRCLDALGASDGDLGAALESLLCNCCELENIGQQNMDYNETKFQEAIEHRQDEVLALESIYGDAFTEVIKDSIWTINLALPFLLDTYKPKDTTTPRHKNKPDDKKEIPRNVCRFFLKGICKFEGRCKFSHVSHNDRAYSKEMNSGSGKLEDGETPGDSSSFVLEVRFPKRSLYPFEPPVVAFYSKNELIPSAGCLNVTLRLMKEAKDLSTTQSPVIFCLATLLENEEEIMTCFKRPPSEFSLPIKKTITPPSFELVENCIDKNSVPIKKPQIKKHEKSSQQLTIQEKNKKLKQQFERLESVAGYKSVLEERKNLPAWKSQQNIIETLKEHQVVVISGMTGCGKTTQIPQFVLDSFIKEGRGGECFIICTQPRRISAMAVAERVSNERIDKTGESVGYQVRLENKQSSKTSLLYCTTGILLRRLEGESSLPGVSHVIVDEVHERTEEGDFLMLVLKDLLTVRPDIRVVLMSATLNAQLFSKYFFDAPVIHIPGRTFPVMELFLEDSIEMTKFQVDPSSPYAKPMKSSSIPNITAGKKNHMLKDIQKMEDTVSGSDFRPPAANIDDQNLSEDQMAWRYASKA
ncbi:putative ATP-dependent RNA helicase DHX57 [Acropora cervicornis]|uniref:RNA helicase n=1 Tax=Acropora cervicornis TaxID=6130 RepID=A0AAD9QU25_ACRCE|nr:putative ATP-dependent RNA helicase DHX57 [Acropora cervicornis]